MKLLLPLLLAALAAAQTAPPPAPLLSDKEAIALYTRAVQLMEAGGVANAELARAGLPVLENARQALAVLRVNPAAASASVHYTFLSNLRAYTLVADTVPKPFPFPGEARAQLHELRDTLARVEVHFQALLNRINAQLRDPDRDNLRRYDEANLKLPAPDPARPRVVFLGDSITDRWRLNEYFPERDFINRGISGQISGQMLGRFRADVAGLKPVAVLILAGTNDIARGVAVATLQQNLTMIADLADHYKIKPIFATLLPVSDYHRDQDPSYERTAQRPPQTIRAVNAWLQRFCAERNYPLVDYWSALADPAGALRAEVAADGLHPDAAGYRLMAPLALAAIDKLAASPAQPPRRKWRLVGK